MSKGGSVWGCGQDRRQGLEVELPVAWAENLNNNNNNKARLMGRTACSTAD